MTKSTRPGLPTGVPGAVELADRGEQLSEVRTTCVLLLFRHAAVAAAPIYCCRCYPDLLQLLLLSNCVAVAVLPLAAAAVNNPVQEDTTSQHLLCIHGFT